jgi:Fur family ferric uptake transcriptional regulator
VIALREHQDNWPAGIKRTRQREAVLAVLEGAGRPVSASDICSQTEKNGEPVWLSTVYRILELLVRKAAVTKITVMNSDVALYEMNRFQHKHYAICVSCRKIISMNNCPMEKFIPKLEDESFCVTGHNLEIYGYCKDCSEKR